MRNLVILFIILNLSLSAQQLGLKGKIVDAESGKPLPKANIVLMSNPAVGVSSNEKGIFELEGDFNKNDTLRVTYIGFKTKLVPLINHNLSKQLLIELESQVIPSQTVLVEGSVGKEGITPLAFGKIHRKEIENDYTVQDIPEYLSELPSTTFFSEGGSGIGYNYLFIRGFDQRRISVSVNGIPQNEPEDHNVYWLDFPDLLASAEMIQVQRGAGSGVFGYPAIGGSINIITSSFSNKPRFNLSTSMGNYNTKKFSAEFSSGLINEKYSVYAKLSQIRTSGYRNESWAKFNSYNISAVRYDENLTTQINFYGGPIEDGLVYTGLAKFAVKDKDLRKANYSYWEADESGYTYTLQRRPSEIENFSQPHFELLNEYRLNKSIIFNSALFYIIGKGFFDYDGSWSVYYDDYFRLRANGYDSAAVPTNALIRAMVENNQFGWIPRMSYKHNNGELIVGAEFRKHSSVHWGSINYAEGLPEGLPKDYHYYYYEGGNDIISGFVHETYNLNEQLNLLGEIQLAYHKYKIQNEKYLDNEFEISGLYLNPRFGVNYKFAGNMNLYFSFARVTREPRLKNYYDAAESSAGERPQFEQNADGSYNFDKPLVEPETMNDFELGAALNKRNFSASVNLFYMIFDDEIVKNGEVDRFGQPITGNVDRTIHTGIELSAVLKPYTGFEIFGNATYSKNYIDNGKFYLDQDNFLDLSGNKIGGFPDLMFNAGIRFNKDGLFTELTGKYVGMFYSDNYDTKLKNYLLAYPGFVSYSDNVNEAYFAADLFASYELKFFNAVTNSKIFVQVNNIFDSLYSQYAIGPEFFPAAERNFLAGIQLGL